MAIFQNIARTAMLGLLPLTALVPPAQAAPLTVEDAVAIALQVQPGEVVEAEADEFDDRLVYDIEILNAAGQEVEFKVDAETGEILDQWTDDDPSNDPEPEE